MNIQTHFYGGLVSAQKALKENIDRINQINVFPVADGDTGTNLFLSVEDNHLAFSDNHSINEQVKLFADVLFAKASGNSGFISSLLFTAFAENIQNSSEFTPIDFANALLLAVTQSINQMNNYVNGSMLAFAQALARLIIQNGFNDWDSKLYDLLGNSMDAILTETSLKNPLLASSGVIDAGSLGLSVWFMGLFSALCGVEIRQLEKTSNVLNIKGVSCSKAIKTEPPSYRYCVQATLVNMTVDKKSVEQLLCNSGDCSLRIFNDSALRFHIHTNKPQAIFSELMNGSSVKDVKIDDMKMQYHAANSRQKIAIVTDSSADISGAVKEKYKVHVIPLSITQGNQKMLDGLTISSESLGQLIDKSNNYPKTSSPALKTIDATFSFLSKSYEHVIAITISSAMSATYSTFCKTAQKYQNISVIDSKRNAGAHGLVVSEIAQLIEKGASVEKILSMAENIIDSKNMYVMVNNFSAMLKSGRVTKSKAWVADAINLKPVVGINHLGQGIVVAKSLSPQRQLKALISLLEKQQKRKKIKGFKTLYVGNYEQACKLDKTLSEILKVKSYGVLHASAVISLHAGHGALAVAIDQEV